MSKVNPNLTFPSGRTIAEVKKDAKRFARTTGIQHSNALNTLARVNGMDMNWNRAMAALARDRVTRVGCQDSDDGSPRIHTVGAIHERIEHRPLRPGSARADKSRHPNADLHIRLVRAFAMYREGNTPIDEIAEHFDIPTRVLRRRIQRLRLNKIRFDRWDLDAMTEPKDRRTLIRQRRHDAE